MTVSTDLANMLYIELEELDLVRREFSNLYESYATVCEYYTDLGNIGMNDKLRADQVGVLQMIGVNRAKIAAVNTLLEPDTDSDEPAKFTATATFTAKAAKDHTASKVTRKSLRANLDASEIADIRARAANGEKYNDLGAAFCVSRATIGNIVQRKGCYA